MDIIPFEAMKLMMEDSLSVEGRFEIARHWIEHYWQ